MPSPPAILPVDREGMVTLAPISASPVEASFTVPDIVYLCAKIDTEVNSIIMKNKVVDFLIKNDSFLVVLRFLTPNFA